VKPGNCTKKKDGTKPPTEMSAKNVHGHESGKTSYLREKKRWGERSHSPVWRAGELDDESRHVAKCTWCTVVQGRAHEGKKDLGRG